MTSIQTAYTDITESRHFWRLTTILRAALSDSWRAAHPATFWPAWDRLGDRKHSFHGVIDAEAILADFRTVLTGIAAADPRLAATDDDLLWLADALRGPDAALTRALLILHTQLTPADDWLTPAEVAALTDTAESGWRNKAAAGDIPGAVKKGKQWLLPRSILKVMGDMA